MRNVFPTILNTKVSRWVRFVAHIKPDDTICLHTNLMEFLTIRYIGNIQWKTTLEPHQHYKGLKNYPVVTMKCSSQVAPYIPLLVSLRQGYPLISKIKLEGQLGIFKIAMLVTKNGLEVTSILLHSYLGQNACILIFKGILKHYRSIGLIPFLKDTSKELTHSDHAVYLQGLFAPKGLLKIDSIFLKHGGLGHKLKMFIVDYKPKVFFLIFY